MIELTAFGTLFLCLTALVLAVRPREFAALLPLAAVMQAPAVVVVSVGGVPHGVTPFNTISAAMGTVLLLRWARNRASVGATLSAAARTLWPGFLLFVTAAALILPVLFEGALVHPLLVEGDINPMPAPNAMSLSHVAQAINSFALFVVLLYLCSEADPRAPVRALGVGLIAAVVVTALLGFYQRGAMLGAWPLAASFWGSNPTYNQWFLVPEYGPYFGRAALPFIEPSYASVWFAAMVCAALTVAVHAPRRFLWPALAMLVLAFVALSNTVGTTGFVVVATFSIAFFVHFLATGRHHAPPHGQWVVFTAECTAIAMVLTVMLDYYYWQIEILQPLRAAIDFTLAKTGELGMTARVISNSRAVDLMFETAWLGAGPGSTRASSYLLALMGNAGVIGVFLFVLALARSLAGSYLGAMRRDESAALALGALSGAGLGVALSISDQNWPMLWACVFYAACCGRAGSTSPALD